MTVNARAIVSRCSSRWALPWGLRVRLAELLMRGIFDTLDEGSYIQVGATLAGGGREALDCRFRAWCIYWYL